MDTLALLVGLIICLTMVNGRSFEDRRDTDLLSDAENEGHKQHGESRHRRRRWYNGYEYPAPPPPYYQERRDYRDQQDLLPKIVRLLEEIAVNVKRPQPPPPPPQPIYIPYPVPYLVPQYTGCQTTDVKTVTKPNITSRFPEMEDTNQNWGFVPEDENQIVGDGVRPISFDPIKPLRPMSRPAPKVEHGSVQADNSFQMSTPGPNQVLDTCNRAIVFCCIENDMSKQKQCFSQFDCEDYYNNNKACSNEAIRVAVEAFKAAYGPERD